LAGGQLMALWNSSLLCGDYGIQQKLWIHEKSCN